MSIDRRRGACLVLLSAFAWSTAGLFTHLLIVDVWTILFWRSVFGCAFVGAYLSIVRGEAPANAIARMNKPAWFVTVVSALGMIAFVPALKLTSVANVAVIYASMPLLAAALGWLLWRSPITLGTIAACLTVLAGTVTIVASSAMGRGGIAGDILALAMTLCMAVMALSFRRHPDLPAMTMVLVSNLLAAVTAMPFAVPLSVSVADLGVLALFGLVQMAMGLAFFSLGSKLLPASTTALIGAVEAPLAALWIWLAFEEVPSRSTLIGGGLIMVAVTAYLLGDVLRELRPQCPLSGRDRIGRRASSSKGMFE